VKLRQLQVKPTHHGAIRCHGPWLHAGPCVDEGAALLVPRQHILLGPVHFSVHPSSILENLKVCVTPLCSLTP
jgi:hypothetical protein